nr:ATP-binding cassette domain-containing protein [Methylibium sp. T29-B]
MQGGESVEVLDIAALCIPSGAIYGLAGPSGCGKTTLLHLCAGLLPPSAGELRVLGTELPLLPQHARDRFRARHVGYVFQRFNLIPAVSAIENVLLPMASPTCCPSRSAGNGRRRCCGASDSVIACTTAPPRCRTASSSASASRARWPTGPRCCWPTSRRRASKPVAVTPCWSC